MLSKMDMSPGEFYDSEVNECSRLRLSEYLITREGPLYEHYDAKEVHERIRNAAPKKLHELVRFCIINAALWQPGRPILKSKCTSREVLDCVRELNIGPSSGFNLNADSITYDQVVDCFPVQAKNFTTWYAPEPISCYTSKDYPMDWRYRGIAALIPEAPNEFHLQFFENVKRALCMFQAEQYHALHPDVPMNKDLVLRFRAYIDSDCENSPDKDFGTTTSSMRDQLASLARCYELIVG